jgi:hypothetical protein
MNFQLGPEIVLSYKRLSYTAWYALAEFVDNSTQAYFSNQEELDPVYKEKKQPLTVWIEATSDFIKITDNSIGMTAEELQRAIILGKPPENSEGRSKYGLGLKTAAFWFGNKVTITTKKLGHPQEITITLSVSEIAENHLNVEPEIEEADLDEHYTIITIEDLNRQIAYRSKAKVKDYLRSFYRVDLSDRKLKLYFNSEPLTWNYNEQLFSKLIKFHDNSLAKRDFTIQIGDKAVTGWAGVLKRGSRALGGFSLLQAKRVIKGWPHAFKTPLIFGQQEGGSNDLVNQRLTGELNVDGFGISHTKDEILFTDEEFEELDIKLAEELQGLVHLASSYRKEAAPVGNDRDKFSQGAIRTLESEIGSPEFITAYDYDIELPEDIIRDSKKIYLHRVREAFQPSREFNVGNITILLYLVSDQSIYDPYLTIESATDRVLIVVVNQSHPHWNQLDSETSVLNFLRHCIYDGLAEWKSSQRLGKIDADTVKLYKDQFLRIPFSMDIHSKPAQAEAQTEEESDEE